MSTQTAGYRGAQSWGGCCPSCSVLVMLRPREADLHVWSHTATERGLGSRTFRLWPPTSIVHTRHCAINPINDTHKNLYLFHRCHPHFWTDRLLRISKEVLCWLSVTLGVIEPGCSHLRTGNPKHCSPHTHTVRGCIDQTHADRRLHLSWALQFSVCFCVWINSATLSDAIYCSFRITELSINQIQK